MTSEERGVLVLAVVGIIIIMTGAVLLSGMIMLFNGGEQQDHCDGYWTKYVLVDQTPASCPISCMNMQQKNVHAEWTDEGCVCMVC